MLFWLCGPKQLRLPVFLFLKLPVALSFLAPTVKLSQAYLFCHFSHSGSFFIFSFSNPLCLSHLSTFLTPTISVTPFRILALSCHKFHTFSLTELFPQNLEFLHWCTFYLDWSTVFLGLNFFLSLILLLFLCTLDLQSDLSLVLSL